MDSIISMFLDDEMGLKEKVLFVNKVHDDQDFRASTIDLLEQEMQLRSDVTINVPAVRARIRDRFMITFRRPLTALACVVLVTAAIIFYGLPGQGPREKSYRFVLFKPDVEEVRISGSFTDWRTLAMSRTGTQGYWEITLDLPEGEHRFVYILDARERITDPTLPGREQDDFGGENSILTI